MMFTTGVALEYFDIYRHLALETACNLEDRNEFKVSTREKMRQNPFLREEDS